MIDFITQHKKGLIGTTVFHTILIVGIVLMKLFAPFPPPDEDGIMINFGTDDEGVGMEEPIRQEKTTPIAQQNNNVEQQEEVIPPTTVPKSIPEPKKEDAEDILTQDIEEAPEIKAAKTKEELEKEKKRQEELERQRQEEKERLKREEDERLRLAEEERQRQIEIDRLAKIEKERKAREEAERKKAEEETKTRKEISDRVKGSFSNIEEGKVNEKVSEGSLYKSGNQGSVSGSDKTKNRANAESSGTKGVDFSLAGRNPIGKLKKPSFPGNEAGIVVVLIVVDKNGKVISATPGHRGTKIMNKELWDAAQKAAFTARFNKASDPNAPNQQGTITYDFTLY